MAKTLIALKTAPVELPPNLESDFTITNTVGNAVSRQIVNTGESGTFTISGADATALSGVGLSISSGGLVSGTTTGNLSRVVTATCTDDDSQTDTVDITFAVTTASGSWTMTHGVSTYNSDDGGTKQAHFRCPFPLVDLSATGNNLRSIQVQFGSSTGTYDILDGIDVFDVSSSKHCVELLIKELTAGTYYWRVAFVTTEGTVGSYCAEQTITAEDAWTAPSSPTTIGQSDMPFTMTASNNYQLSEDISTTGKAITFASNCTLDLNGFDIDGCTSSASDTVQYPTSVTGTRLFDSSGTYSRITCDTSGSSCIGQSGNPGDEDNIIHGVELEATSTDVGCVTLGFCRIFDSKIKPTGGNAPSSTSLLTAGLDNIANVYVHDCEFLMATDEGRSYWAHNAGGSGKHIDIWNCSGTVNHGGNSTTINCGVFAQRGRHNLYMHGIEITQCNADRCRHFFVDGDGRYLRALDITADLTDSLNTSTHALFQIRNDGTVSDVVKDCHLGYISANMGGTTAGQTALYLAHDFEWDSLLVNDFDVDEIRDENGAIRVHTNFDNCTIYRGTWTKDSGYTGNVGGFGAAANSNTVLDINEITVVGSGSTHWKGPGSGQTNSDYNINNSWASGESSDTSRETYYTDTPQGYDMTGTPPTPTTMVNFSGVL